MTVRQWLVVDSDAGVDDAVALCVGLKLAHRHGFEFKLITCSFGNVGLEQVCLNVAQCVAACCCCSPRGAPGSNSCQAAPPRIVRGASRCLNGEVIDASHFHGLDGLGDAGLPMPPEDLLPAADATCGEREAASEIVRVCKEAAAVGAKVTVVTIGPLTNLALALEEEKNLPSLVPRLIVMGGCGNSRGNHGRVTEFNVHADPEASAVVFAQRWPKLEVLSWEATCVATVPWPQFDQIIYGKTAQLSQAGRFLAAVCHLPYVQKRAKTSCHRPEPSCWEGLAISILERSVKTLYRLLGLPPFLAPVSQPGAIICDALAVAAALRPEIVLRSSAVHVEVELQGTATRGQTVVDWGTCFDGCDRPKDVSWIEEVDVSMFCRMLRETVEGGA
eukprot:TRINITY_DN110584_c0_g1_i1.p1 TRINITY_DN110584_c0_g1~~TRINITY_DN110584_c0_g1_i1.p1  ORF type:complete len:389 (+),score=75.84 TRINITY_DN110584_c0_g1_i1:40-1206(+)